jgi:hypothetical protein
LSIFQREYKVREKVVEIVNFAAEEDTTIISASHHYQHHRQH